MTQGLRAKQMLDTFSKVAESKLKQHRTVRNLFHTSGTSNVTRSFTTTNSKLSNLTSSFLFSTLHVHIMDPLGAIAILHRDRVKLGKAGEPSR